MVEPKAGGKNATTLSSENLGELAICHKNEAGQVLFQNEACRLVCGNQCGNVCVDNCMSLYKAVNPQAREGTHQFRSTEIAGKNYDILMINTGEVITTILFELTGKKKRDLEFISQFNLTVRESEIVNLILDGKTNKEISSALFISLKTVKTHINNILKKVPDYLLQR